MFTFIPDTQFPIVTAEIIDFAQTSLESQRLFANNILRARRRKDTFARLLLQFEQTQHLAIDLDDATYWAIWDAYDLTQHNLQVVRGTTEILAYRLGWNDVGIAQLRNQARVLEPLLSTLRSYRSAASEKVRT